MRSILLVKKKKKIKGLSQNNKLTDMNPDALA